MAKSSILKVFSDPAEQKELGESYKVLEHYDAFCLLEVNAAGAKKLSKSHVAEDITDEYEVLSDGRQIAMPPKTAGAVSRVRASKGDKRLGKGKHHYLVQFQGPVKQNWLTQVKRAGAEIREPFGGFVYVVRADAKTAADLQKLACVRSVAHLPHSHRLASALSAGSVRRHDGREELPRTRKLPGMYVVSFFGPKDAKAARPAVKKIGWKVVEADLKAAILIVEAPESTKKLDVMLEKLAAVHGVRRVRERVQKRPSNDVGGPILGTAVITSNPGLGLDGSGEIVAVCDTGLDTGVISTIHQDFAGRVVAMKSYPLPASLNQWVSNPQADDGPSDLDSGHGTHVAGSVLGNGKVSQSLPGQVAPIRGLAHKAKLVMQAVEQRTDWLDPADLPKFGRFGLWGIPTDLKSLFQFAYTQGARIHSNSWGGGDPGAYDVQCRQLDEFVWKHPDLCVLVAAGNDGTDQNANGVVDLQSVTSPGTAKNCITVGACESLRPAFNAETYGKWWPDDYPAAPLKNDPMADNSTQVVAFSSRGPTTDGRVKPDVVAPGTFILSTRSTMIAANNFAWRKFPPSKKYFYMGGTSMATPLAAGAVALLRQFLRTKKNIASPSAALLKAALVAGAQRLPGTSAGAISDMHQGFGRVNLDNICVTAAGKSVAFFDAPQKLQTGMVFAHSLNVPSGATQLRIVLAYSDFPGSQLINNLNLIATAPNGAKFVGNQSATGGLTPDTKNNVEVVHLINPKSGSWTVQVVGSNVPKGPQPFALVILRS